MAFPFLPKLRPASCGDPGAEVPFGCVFAGGQYLARTAIAPASATRFWLYAEVRRHKLGVSEHIFTASLGNNVFTIGWDGNDRFGINMGVAGSSTTGYAYTDRAFRDLGATYAVLVDIETNRVPAADRLTLTVLGERQAWSAGSSFLGQGTALWAHPAGYQQRLGSGVSSYYGATYSNLTISRFACGDGAGEIAASAFGYRNRFGVWVPKAMPAPASLPLGNNGCVLDFADPLDLGHDVSGKANHWTASGLTAAHQVTDTPTHGYPTVNPLAWRGPVGGDVLDGGLTWRDATGSPGAAWKSRWATLPGRGGKVYAEARIGYSGSAAFVPGNVIVGLHDGGADAYCGASLATIGYRADGKIVRGGAVVGTAPAYGPGDTVTTAYDVLTGSVWFGKNAAPDTAAAPAATGLGAGLYFGASSWWVNPDGWNFFYWSFGQRGFAYAPPAGYRALNTAAMSCPAIKHPGRYFATRLRSAGAGIADLPWNPLAVKTLVLSKRLDASADWRVNDSLRPGRAWATNLATADFADPDGLAFTANGYTVGGAPAYAGSCIDYIWRAAPASGFDIVVVDHVTGSPTTIPHAVGGPVDYAWVVPLAGGNRRIFHRSLAAGQYLALNAEFVPATEAGWFASSAVDATLGASLPTGRYALYLWRAVPQFSAFGSYTGNGAAEGPFVPTDFEPGLLFERNLASTNQWYVLDTTRSPSNPLARYTMLGFPNAEGSGITFGDALSNGLKLRSTATVFNGAGHACLFASWAKTPIKFARAR